MRKCDCEIPVIQDPKLKEGICFRCKGQYFRPEPTLSELLDQIGIKVDCSKKVGNGCLLTKNGKKLGYFTASQAHDRFIKRAGPASHIEQRAQGRLFQ